MSFLGNAINKKELIIFSLIAIVIGGVFIFNKMSKLEDPEISVKQALIYTRYSGATPHEVELQVTDIIEKRIREMGNIEDIDSRSMAGLSEIKVSIKNTVRSKDLQQMWDMLRRKVKSAQPYLPDGASEPIVMDDFGDVYGMFFALSSDGYNYEELVDYADMLQRELLLVKGVRRVNLFGKRMSCVNIKFSMNKINKLGVHPIRILTSLSAQNKVYNSGNLNVADERIRINFDSKFKTVDDIRNMIVSGYTGEQIMLKDIATVEKDYVEPYSQLLRYNRYPAIGLAISMESGENVIELGKAINKRIDELKGQIPVGIEMNPVFYQPELVENSINEFMINLIESVLIVILVLMVSMGFRSGLIISSGLIFTILGTFIILYMFGGTIQRVSLSSFIIAMGMLVDNSIVVFDGIRIDLKKGMDKNKALVHTAQKTAVPLLGATFVAILAFMPIFMSRDSTGEFTKDLFIVIAVSLLLSWVLSMIQTPFFTKYFWKEKKSEREKVVSDPYDTKFYRAFRKFLERAIKHKYITILVTLIIFFASVFGFKYVRKSFFPDMKYKQFVFEYMLPEGRSIDAVERDLEKIENYLSKNNKIKGITTALGATPARYSLMRPMSNPASNYGEIIIETKEFEDVEVVSSDLEKYARNNFPDANARIRFYKAIFTQYPIEAQFSGPDPAVLRELSEKAKVIMKKSPKMSIVTDNWKNKVKVWSPQFADSKALRSNVSKMNLAHTLATVTDGIAIGVLNQSNDILPVYLKVNESELAHIENIENAPVWGMSMMSVPVKQITDGIDIRWEDPVIHRNNNRRSIRVQASAYSEFTTEEALSDVKSEIDNMQLPEGYSLKWYGTYKSSTQANKYLMEFMPFAIILMIFIVIALFNSFKEPIMIFISIPLAVIGISIGMLMTGKEFGFTSIVGTLGLIGMMIKNAIVLIDQIKFEIQNGKSRYNSIVDSTVSRFNPVLLASFTTILGMIPLINDKLFGSMAVAIMFGLFFGTIITLVIIPVLYSLFFKVSIHEKE